MTVWGIGPDWVRVHYTSNGHSHVMNIPYLASGTVTPGTMPDCVKNNASVVGIDTAMETFLTKTKVFHADADSYDRCVALHQDDPFADVVQIIEWNPTAQPNSVSADVDYEQYVMTFRSVLGHHFRLYLMETTTALNLVVPYPYTGYADAIALHDFMVGADGFVRARDGGILLSSTRFVTKMNDALRKKFVLNA